MEGLSRLQLFVYLQARRFARHPDCSHRCISSIQGGHGFYVPAYLGLLPRRAGDMLTVRFGQLTVGGLSPPKIRSLAGCSQTPTETLADMSDLQNVSGWVANPSRWGAMWVWHGFIVPDSSLGTN